MPRSVNRRKLGETCDRYWGEVLSTVYDNLFVSSAIRQQMPEVFTLDN